MWLGRRDIDWSMVEYGNDLWLRDKSPALKVHYVRLDNFK